jgi:predicted O-methyltransferase YrrM
LPPASEIEDGARRTLDRISSIPGWLRDEDVVKLYELAYRTPGPILEIGSARGKSAAVIASALRDASSSATFVSLDVDAEALEDAAATLADLGLGERVLFVRGSARAFFHSVSHFAPALVFVDGDHSESGVLADLRELERRVPSGGVLVLHDYYDPPNPDPAAGGFGVVAAVERSWVPRECDFEGVFGACGVYRRKQGAAAPRPGAGPAPIVDLSHRDPLRLRLLGRGRLPLARRYRWLRAKLRRRGRSCA